MDFLFGAGGRGGGNGQGPKGAQAAPAADQLVKEGSAASFTADVLEASMQAPVIAAFYAPGPSPDKMLPALEKLVAQARGAVRLVKLNLQTPQNQQIAAQLRIRAVPTVYAFKGGRPVDGFEGALPESQLKSFIERLTAGQQPFAGIDDLLAEAKRLLAEGDVAQATDLFQEVLAEDPQNAPALAGLIRCALAAGQVEDAKEILANLPPEIARHAEIQGVRSAIDLAEQAAAAQGATGELRRRLEQDPNDHQARFDLAMAHFASGEREAAVEALLEIVKRDRTWNDDGARKQLVKFFEAFGHADPLTVATRRRLSSLLFS